MAGVTSQPLQPGKFELPCITKEVQSDAYTVHIPAPGAAGPALKAVLVSLALISCFSAFVSSLGIPFLAAFIGMFILFSPFMVLPGVRAMLASETVVVSRSGITVHVDVLGWTSVYSAALQRAEPGSVLTPTAYLVRTALAGSKVCYLAGLTFGSSLPLAQQRFLISELSEITAVPLAVENPDFYDISHSFGFMLNDFDLHAITACLSKEYKGQIQVQKDQQRFYAKIGSPGWRPKLTYLLAQRLALFAVVATLLLAFMRTLEGKWGYLQVIFAGLWTTPWLLTMIFASLRGAYISERIYLDDKTFVLEHSLWGWKSVTSCPRTGDCAAKLVYFSDVHRPCAVSVGNSMFLFGFGLPVSEKAHLLDEINDFCATKPAPKDVSG